MKGIAAWRVFSGRMFVYLDWIQENADQKELRIWTLFTQWIAFLMSCVRAVDSFSQEGKLNF